jgi:hypothetical protein
MGEGGNPMINLYTTLGIAILLIITNYLAFGYGIRIGKAMQKDIPLAPLVEPVKKAARGAFKLAKNIKNKSYVQKKADKEEFGIFD